MNKQEALFKYALWLGDNALVLGHRVSEWTSRGPILEEDLALSNIALDLLGQANSFLVYAGKIEGKNRDQDDLAFKRDERHFLNAQICELPNGDFAYTVARQFIFSHFGLLLFSELSQSKDETIAGIAAKSVKEYKYHVRHFNQWMLRLGDGTEESHEKIQTALNAIWTYTGDLFAMAEFDTLLLQEGISVDLQKLHPIWKKNVEEIIREATLTMPSDEYMQKGSKDGIHTEYLGYILAEMQFLPRAYPNAKW